MAAERIVGRPCACGCGEPIEPKRKNATLRLECRAKRDSELHAQRHREKTMRVQDKRRRTPNPRINFVRHVQRVTWRDDPNRRQDLCKVCFGMPWAREPERCNDGHLGKQIPVAGDNRLCHGCGEPWAPEPPPEQGSLITSSAGMTARHADLHSINFNVDWDKKSKGKKYGR